MKLTLDVFKSAIFSFLILIVGSSAQSQSMEAENFKVSSGSFVLNQTRISKASFEIFQESQRRMGKSVPMSSDGVTVVTYDDYRNSKHTLKLGTGQKVFFDPGTGAEYIYQNGVLGEYKVIEEQLLESSETLGSPHESLVVVPHSSTEKVETPLVIIKGKAFQVEASVVEKELNRVLAQHPQSVDRIELLHTHPFFELRSGHDSSSLCLSLQDLDIAKTISLQLFVPVIIRAILPNGYSFAAAFRNGKNISSKYFLKEN